MFIKTRWEAMDRRAFLTAGVHATVALSSASLLSRHQSVDGRLTAVRCFVFDAERPDGTSIADLARRHVSAMCPVPSDVSGVWDRKVDLQIRRSPAIAGVTGEHALFVIERLAWDSGKKLTYRRRLDGAGKETVAAAWLGQGILPPPTARARGLPLPSSDDLVFWILESVGNLNA